MKFIKLSIYASIFVMSIVYMMLAFMFLPSPDEARLQFLQFHCTSFEKAEQLAIQDFQKGKYHLSFEGWHQSTKKQMILDSILRTDYKIGPLYTGCVGTTDEVYHYLNTMATQLENQFGRDFLNRAKARQVTVWGSLK